MTRPARLFLARHVWLCSYCSEGAPLRRIIFAVEDGLRLQKSLVEFLVAVGHDGGRRRRGQSHGCRHFAVRSLQSHYLQLYCMHAAKWPIKGLLSELSRSSQVGGGSIRYTMFIPPIADSMHWAARRVAQPLHMVDRQAKCYKQASLLSVLIASSCSADEVHGASAPVCVIIIRVWQRKPILEPLKVLAALLPGSAGEPRVLTVLETLQLVQQLMVVALVTEGPASPHGARDLSKQRFRLGSQQKHP